MVHFVMPNGDHRPATIVSVEDEETGLVNLTINLDPAKDGYYKSGSGVQTELHAYRQNADYDPTGEAHNTWHWMEFVPPRD